MNQLAGYGIASAQTIYPNESTARPTEMSSVASRMVDNNEKFAAAAHRISNVLDRLQGPRPEAVGNVKDQSQPSAIMHRVNNELDISAALASKILELADRLEGIA